MFAKVDLFLTQMDYLKNYLNLLKGSLSILRKTCLVEKQTLQTCNPLIC